MSGSLPFIVLRVRQHCCNFDFGSFHSWDTINCWMRGKKQTSANFEQTSCWKKECLRNALTFFLNYLTYKVLVNINCSNEGFYQISLVLHLHIFFEIGIHGIRCKIKIITNNRLEINWSISKLWIEIADNEWPSYLSFVVDYGRAQEWQVTFMMVREVTVKVVRCNLQFSLNSFGKVIGKYSDKSYQL